MLKCGNAGCSMWSPTVDHCCKSWAHKLSSECGFFEYHDINEGPEPDTKDIECLSETKAVEPEEVPGGSCPNQYSFPEEACELQDLIEYRAMNFAIGNIFKACFRMGTCDHSDQARDLNKIIFFAKRELKRIQGREVL